MHQNPTAIQVDAPKSMANALTLQGTEGGKISTDHPGAEKQRAMQEMINNSSQVKQFKSLQDMANSSARRNPTPNPPVVQRAILNRASEKMTDELLEDQINHLPDEIQEILWEIHADPETGFTLNEAIDIANQEMENGDGDGEDEAESAAAAPRYAGVLGDADLPDDEDSEWVDSDSEEETSDEEDSGDDSASTAAAAPSRKRKAPRKKEQQGSFKTHATFKGSSPRSAGDPVSIEREEINHPGGRYRTSSVSAFVSPRPTTGRPGAPEPDGGVKVGIKWKEVGSTSTRNTGIVDAQKGHIMALELGGPDIPENIVPQWAQWQSNGAWRRAEVAILARALEEQIKGNRVKFHCELRYKKYVNIALGTAKGVFVPSGFLITITVHGPDGEQIGDAEVMYNAEQAQDDTDRMLADRVFDKADGDDSTGSGGAGSAMDTGSAAAAAPAPAK